MVKYVSTQAPLVGVEFAAHSAANVAGAMVLAHRSSESDGQQGSEQKRWSAYLVEAMIKYSEVRWSFYDCAVVAGWVIKNADIAVFQYRVRERSNLPLPGFNRVR